MCQSGKGDRRFSTETSSKQGEVHDGAEAGCEIIRISHLPALKFMAKGHHHCHAHFCFVLALVWVQLCMCTHFGANAMKLFSNLSPF